MTVTELQQEILRLKKEKNVCILAHAYQRHDIWEVADFVGDSFGLSQQAAKTDADIIIMCGVRFMAETAKILSSDKKVLLSAKNAGCPMADTVTAEDVRRLKNEYPNYKIAAYINTTAEVKTECDVCVTSASAESIVEKLDSEGIVFLPDVNLGGYIKEKLPEKNIVLYNGCCPYHAAVTVEDVKKAREAHPEALLLVHPECPKEVSALADYVGSTTGIIDFAKKSDKKEFIIGTENSIVEHLGFMCEDKRFYPLSSACFCRDMMLTTLVDVYNCLKGDGGEEIILSSEVITKAKKPIDEMLRLG